MTPGPAPVPEEVLLELARPVIHHRSAEAKQVITEVVRDLKDVFQTRNDVLILTSSGTGVPFLVYVLDNGRSSAALSDGISPFAIVGPEETPVAGFPYVCPSPASPLGYHSLTSGDIIAR